MSTIPAEIPGIGASSQKVRVNSAFNPITAGIGPQEYFVLSRIDGKTSLRDLLLSTGLSPEQCVLIAQRLRSLGAMLLPNETTAPSTTTPGAARTASVATAPAVARTILSPAVPAVARTASSAGSQRVGTAPTASSSAAATAASRSMPAFIEPPTTARGIAIGAKPIPGGIPPLEDPATLRGPRATVAAAVRIADLDLSLPSPSGDEVSAMAEFIDLSEGERRRLLALARLVSKRDPWALFGVPKGSPDKDLKRAYFRLSKDIHPDRYFGKKLGSFNARLASVFEAVARAYAELTNKKAAAVVAARASDEPQTQQAYAQELFDRACHAEVSGDAENAMKLFAAAVRLEPQVRYLRRAANCALLSSQPRTAVEYAKKAASIAPDDPSCARLLAQCFKALGQLDAAEEVLVMAMAIKSENDMLSAELRNDLKDVQRALGRR